MRLPLPPDPIDPPPERKTAMAPQRTLALIKSAAVTRGQADLILARAEAAGLRIVARSNLHLDDETCRAFYAEHVGREYFPRLAGSVQGPDGIVVAVLEGDEAVKSWRAQLGATDPSKAAPGTIRADFGTQLPDNAAHGSDAPESAAREIGVLFPDLA